MRLMTVLSLVLSSVPFACSSGGLEVGRDLGQLGQSSEAAAGGGEGGSAQNVCESVGGKCLLGSAVSICTKQAPTADQDCNPDRNPGGAFCCLEVTNGTNCTAAGGSCVLGNVSCAKQANAGDQDCNEDLNPGGAFCCLEQESGSSCTAAGGSCVLGNVSCAKEAPTSDQDCNPDRNPGGTFCCLEK